MKLTSATLVSLVFLMSSAVAEESYQAAASGTLTLQIAPPKPVEAAAAPQAGKTLTVQVVRPAASGDDGKDAEQRDLETCGAKWNAKLNWRRPRATEPIGRRGRTRPRNARHTSPTKFAGTARLRAARPRTL